MINKIEDFSDRIIKFVKINPIKGFILTTLLAAYVILPFADFSFKGIINLLIFSSKAFSDNYYSTIAENDNTEFLGVSQLAILMFLIHISTSISRSLSENRYALDWRYGILRSYLIGIFKKLNPDADYSEETIELDKQPTRSQSKFPHLIFLIFAGYFYCKAAFCSTAARENAFFKNTITRLSPFMLDIDRKIIEAEWASMVNKRTIIKLKINFYLLQKRTMSKLNISERIIDGII